MSYYIENIYNLLDFSNVQNPIFNHPPKHPSPLHTKSPQNNQKAPASPHTTRGPDRSKSRWAPGRSEAICGAREP